MIELMLALALFTFITTIMWGSFAQTANSKRAVQSEQERTHSVRVALMRMAREIEMAYLSDNENTAISHRRTLFVASSRVDVDELTFSTFAHQRLRAGAAEGDTSLITYFGARDPDDRRILNLMRRETRRLQAEDPQHAARRGVHPLPGRRAGEVRVLGPQEEGVGDRLEHPRRERHGLPAHARPHHADRRRRARERGVVFDRRPHPDDREGQLSAARPAPAPTAASAPWAAPAPTAPR